MLVKCDPPKGMLDYTTSREGWYVTLHTTQTESQETEPYRVIASYGSIRHISVETPDGMIRVPVTRVASHYKENHD